MLPLLRSSFGLDYFRSGLLVSSFSLAYGFAQLPAGWLADRMGRRRLLSLGLVASGLFAVAIGLSGSLYQIALLLALIGVAGGAYHPSAPALIAEAAPQEMRGRALGIHLVGGSASFFLTPLLAGLIATFWGWRGAFLLLPLPALATGALFWKAVKESREVGRGRGESGGLRDVGPRLGPVVGLSIVAQMVTVALMAFIPLYLVDKHSVDPKYAGMMLSLIYGTGLFAGPLGGALSDRVGRRPVILLSVLATGPLIYLFTLVPFGPGLFALFIVLGTAMYTRMPVIESLIVDVVPAGRRSSALGMYYFTSMEASSVIVPLVGFLFDRLGLDQTFTLLAAVVSVATLLGWLALRLSRS